MTPSTTSIFGLCLVFAGLPVSAATLRVPQQFPSIQAAVDAAAAHDTVLVGPGRYVENVVIRKPLELRSTHGAARTAIDAHQYRSALTILGGEKKIRVAVNGFTLTNGRYVFGSEGGPDFTGAGLAAHFADVRVRDNVIEGNAACIGALLVDTSIAIVSDNIVRNNPGWESCSSTGIVVFGSSFDSTPRAVIEHNDVYGNGSGIAVGILDDATVRNNHVHDNAGLPQFETLGAGITVYCCTSGVIQGNYVHDNKAFNGAGLALNQEQFKDDRRADLLVTGNVLTANRVDQLVGSPVWLFVFQPNSLTMVGNSVTGNTAAPLVQCEMTERRPLVFANSLINSGSGPLVAPACAP